MSQIRGLKVLFTAASFIVPILAVFMACGAFTLRFQNRWEIGLRMCRPMRG